MFSIKIRSLCLLTDTCYIELLSGLVQSISRMFYYFNDSIIVTNFLLCLCGFKVYLTRLTRLVDV